MPVPVVVRVLGISGEAVVYRHSVYDAFQRVRPPAPLVRCDLVVEDRQIVRADLLRLPTSNIEQGVVFGEDKHGSRARATKKGGPNMFDCDIPGPVGVVHSLNAWQV